MHSGFYHLLTTLILASYLRAASCLCHVHATFLNISWYIRVVHFISGSNCLSITFSMIFYKVGFVRFSASIFLAAFTQYPSDSDLYGIGDNQVFFYCCLSVSRHYINRSNCRKVRVYVCVHTIWLVCTPCAFPFI